MNAELWKKEFWSCLAMRHCHGLGPRTWKELLLRYSSPYAAVADARNWTRKGLVRENVAQRFRAEEWRDKARKEWTLAQACGYEVVIWTDERYPERLKHTPDPPLFLYAMGDLSLLANPGVAVVGSRGASKHGLAATAELCRRLSKAGLTVVSGMAWGIDREAHLNALTGAGSSIGVLGTGLDMIYPADNRDVWERLRELGLLVSEFAPGTPPASGNFPRRNRIISGLALGVVVAEAPERSGALITARHALETGREVFAMSGPENLPTFEGCRRLIDEGATLARSVDDVLLTLMPLLHSGLDTPSERTKERGEASRQTQMENFLQFPADGLPPGAPPDTSFVDNPIPEEEASPKEAEAALPGAERLEGEEGLLVTLLASAPRLHIDALSQRLGWESQKVSRMLVVLEMKGLVKREPGMLYRAVG